MATQTRYHRSDQHTINGLAAYQLGTANSATVVNLWDNQTDVTTYWRSDVIQRNSAGGETALGSNVAVVSRITAGEGYQSNTWSCPLTTLAAADAIKIVEKIFNTAGGVMTSRNFITEQLGWTQLNSATWTFTRYTRQVDFEEHDDVDCEMVYISSDCYLYHGDASRDTRIAGIDYTTYQDIGLRVRTSSATIKIGVLALEASHKLRIRKGDTTYGIPLLATNDAYASGLRIYDGANVKALPKVA